METVQIRLISTQAKIAVFIIRLLPKEMQFKVHSMLNSWKLHWVLLFCAPNYRKMSHDEQMIFYKPISNYMNKKFGRKEILRYHNVRSKSKGDMTNDQFNKWWFYCVERDMIDLYYTLYPTKSEY
jgi:hypothetical protein